MSGTVFSIIVLISIVGICFCVYKIKTYVPIRRGDIVIDHYDYDNPFKDNTYNYETITEVRKNQKGKYYFKSYTSDKFGNRSKWQSSYSSEHNEGKKLIYDDEYIIVNHIDLDNMVNIEHEIEN